MDKRVENFLKYGDKEMAGSEMGSNAFVTALFMWLGAVIVNRKFLPSIGEIVYLVLIVCIGFFVKHRNLKKEIYLYRGVVMIGCSILSFRISYGGVAMGHHVEQFVIGAYIIVFLLCSVAELYFIIRLVKKDAYNQKEHSVSAGTILIGSGLSVLLCPLIFSGFSENQLGGVIAIGSLLMGAIFIFGVGNFYKAYLYKKYENVL